jgi:hypothetical protein
VAAGAGQISPGIFNLIDDDADQAAPQPSFQMVEQ